MTDDVLNIDLEHLTVGEIETVEELAGAPLDRLWAPDQPKGKVLRALGCVMRRRTDPDFTWEQAGNLRVVLSEPEADPT